MKQISHYCQGCGTANAVGEDVCKECGTRLMIITFPINYRFENSIEPSYYEHFLLEKLSLLELRLMQLQNHQGRMLNVIERQNEIIEKIIEKQKETEKKFTKTQKIKTEKKDFIKQILENYEGERRELFEKLVNDSVNFLSQREEKQALRTLSQAEKLSPKNLPLLIFIGKTLFDLDKFSEAEKHLEKSLINFPSDEKIQFLLAATSANNGETQKAEIILEDFEKENFAVNYVLGFIEASRENWLDSLTFFKNCLKLSEFIEIEYLIACVYFQLENFEDSLKFAEKCCEKEENFADAWFLQSMIYGKLNDSPKSAEMFDKAKQTNDLESQCVLFFNKKSNENIETALPFLGLKKQILTSGSRRLAKIFRQKLNEAIS
jgi:tetratricopeptide (TPR) repeat protein